MLKIAMFNKKGGVGKTTTTINVAELLATEGNSVLILDLDSQADSSKFYNINNTECTMYNLLKDKKVDYLRLVNPASSNVNIITNSNFIEINNLLNKEDITTILKEKVGPLEQYYNYIIIDCCPTACNINTAILHYVDKICVVTDPDTLAVNNITQVIDYLKEEEISIEKIFRIIVNKYQKTRKTHTNNVQILKDIFKDKVNSPIPLRSVLENAFVNANTIKDIKDKEINNAYVELINKIKEAN